MRTQKQIKKMKIFQRIQDYAKHSMYRMNASSAKYYHFSIDDDGRDWQGGYTWNPENLYGDKNCIEIENGQLVK